MKKLTITTIRFLTDEELDQYKEITPMDINWEFLEKHGEVSIYDKNDKTVRSYALLTNV